MSQDAFQIYTFPIGPLQTNSYLIHSATEAVIIDAGDDPYPMLKVVEEKKLTLTNVLCTHLHFDHTYGLAALIKSTGIIPQASNRDAYLLENLDGKAGRAYGFPPVEDYTFTNLDEGTLSILGTTCTVLATPGHTPGGLSYFFPEAKAVFVGDVLFYRSVGRADLAGGDQATLCKSIREKLYTLPPETKVFPGHSRATSIGEEKLNNPFVSDFQ